MMQLLKILIPTQVHYIEALEGRLKEGAVNRFLELHYEYRALAKNTSVLREILYYYYYYDY